jgi:hypothetical protein
VNLRVCLLAGRAESPGGGPRGAARCGVKSAMCWAGLASWSSGMRA